MLCPENWGRLSPHPSGPSRTPPGLTVQLVVDHLLQVGQALQDGFAVGQRAPLGLPAAPDLHPPLGAALQAAVGGEDDDAHEHQDVDRQQSFDLPGHRHERGWRLGAASPAGHPRGPSGRRSLHPAHGFGDHEAARLTAGPRGLWPEAAER